MDHAGEAEVLSGWYQGSIIDCRNRDEDWHIEEDPGIQFGEAGSQLYMVPGIS